ncbi:response regulator [Cryobacterium roopkundense]|uniref:CheY-like chemotaxis protein/HPt (Histidine-containing phosphotransfer) domain-containing protein n=1 Tax=Cryobacterium roopkundense TaxID=1001240 RepID=A0A7W8ZXD1_9MICO|nr:response regulator [Cryobacterium roopkundense]MBB5641660.1 CheY-like chemotaxis protein/HPt (histidine-containing phosphotransfer) domain-containing protein [Cryobacterium roopkundense]
MARILIVEDNPANLKLATLLLSRAGHSVMAAVDAEVGLALAVSEHPDLILMDIQLPGMDGLTATSILKANPATSAIPVIALTAMAMKSDQEKSRLAGCDGYITKPLRYQELYAAIDALLADLRQTGSAAPLSAPSADEGLLESTDAAGTDGPAVVISVLEGLVGNDPAVLLDFLEMFQSSTVAIAHELVTACLMREAVSAGAQAHKLKSSARAVGAIRLGTLCSLLEVGGRANDMETLMGLLPKFEAEIDAVNTAIDELRQSSTPAHTEFSPHAAQTAVGPSEKLGANE